MTILLSVVKHRCFGTTIRTHMDRHITTIFVSRVVPVPTRSGRNSDTAMRRKTRHHLDVHRVARELRRASDLDSITPDFLIAWRWEHARNWGWGACKPWQRFVWR
jgi:hypothetical protein